MYATCIAALMRSATKSMALARVWKDRMLKRRQLAAMGERDLKDIRLSLIDAAREWRKPFWRP